MVVILGWHRVFIMMYYFLRGIVAALLVYMVLSRFISHSIISIVIIYGLAFSIPFISLKHVAKVLSIVFSITAIHALHIMIFNFYNELMEFSVVVLVWITILWISIRERWVKRIAP